MPVMRRMFFALAVVAVPMPLRSAMTDETILAAMERRYERLIAGGEYIKRTCSKTALASYGSLPLLRCRYSELGASAEVTLALPDAKRRAR